MVYLQWTDRLKRPNGLFKTTVPINDIANVPFLILPCVQNTRKKRRRIFRETELVRYVIPWQRIAGFGEFQLKNRVTDSRKKGTDILISLYYSPSKIYVKTGGTSFWLPNLCKHDLMCLMRICEMHCLFAVLPVWLINGYSLITVEPTLRLYLFNLWIYVLPTKGRCV